MEAHLTISPYIGVHGYFGRERAKTRSIRPRLLDNDTQELKAGVFGDDLHEVHGVSTIYRQLNRVQGVDESSSITLIQCSDSEIEGITSIPQVTRLPLLLYVGR